MKKVFIVGSAGTTGLVLKARLAKRSDVELLEIEEGLRKDKDEIRRLIELSDFCFLCLPDAAALETAELARGCGARIIDTSTAHRCSSGWVYGFPELSQKHRDSIAQAKYLASPGCHASGIIALSYPLLQRGIIGTDYPLCCTSITGYSGGGKKMIEEYESPLRSSSLSSPMEYAMSQAHKHLPEIIAQCGLSQAPCFMPIVGSFYSGMLVSIPLHRSLMKKSCTITELRSIYKEHYADGGLITVMDDAPDKLYAGSMSGRDDMAIFISGNDDRIILSALYDNLGKGASGAALQCFNIMTGTAEESGLNLK